MVLIPIVVPFFSSLGLNMEQIMLTQAIFGISVAIMEVPSGYFSDLIGRKRSLMIGAFFWGVGFTYLYFAKSFYQICIYEIFLGIGVSFVSGSDLSLLMDSINDDREQSKFVVANRQMALVSGEAVASMLCSALVLISMDAVLNVQVVLGWLPLLMTFLLKEPTRSKPQGTHLENFKEVFHIMFKKDRLLRYIVINKMMWGLCTFAAIWLIQKMWQEQNVHIAYFGILWGALNLSVGIIGKKAHALEEKWGTVAMLVHICFLPILGYLGLGLFSGLWTILLCFTFYISRAFNSILFLEAINWRIDSRLRATINSMSSLFFRLGFFILGPAIGYSSDTIGLQTTFLILGGGYILVFLVFMRPMITEVKKLDLGYK